MTQAALATKLVAAGKAIGHISKTGRNDFHKYDYVTDADVMDKAGAALDEQGIATFVNIRDVQHEFGDTGTVFTTVLGDVTWMDDTGAAIVTGFAGTGTDKGDKGYYKAVTGGVKYCFLKTLRIPTGDDPEVDTAERQSAKSNESRPSNATGPTPPRAQQVGLSPQQVKLLKATLDDAGLKSSSQKAAFTVQVVGKGHSKEMTNDDLDKILTEVKLGDESRALANALAVV